MRKISKGDTPDFLKSKKCAEAKAKIQAMIRANQNPDYKDFDGSVYGEATVRQQLKSTHHNRCAYCGCSLQGCFIPVEHYRPKTAYQIALKAPLIHPGYHWLAYEWNNLLYSCQECNSRKFKGNLFPLIDESKRNIKGKDISNEIPVLINPATEDPDNYFEYDTWIILPKSGINPIARKRAEGTIGILCLNGQRIENGKVSFPRASLIEERKMRWDEVNSYVDLLMSNNPALSREEAKKLVAPMMRLTEGDYGFMFADWV